MGRRLVVELLATRIGIEVPDEEWARFLRLMWYPFVVDDSSDDTPTMIEIRPNHQWTWELRAGDELLGAGPNRWFLSGELRYWVVRRAIQRFRGNLLHASVVSREGRALLLLAGSGGGKTTLSLALASEGWSYHGDDLAAIHSASLEVTALPTPAGIRDPARWPELRELWGEVAPWTPESNFLIPTGSFAAAAGTAMPVAALAFLDFGIGKTRVLEGISAAEATLLCAKAGASRSRSALTTFSALCRKAVCARLSYSTSSDALRSVEELWLRANRGRPDP